MKRSSNVSMLYRRGSMTKKTWKSSKQHHHLSSWNIAANEESIKLHGNSVSVQQVQKYHINIMAPWSTLKTIIIIPPRENSELSACFKDFKKCTTKRRCQWNVRLIDTSC
jgi:hypothetical protein